MRFQLYVSVICIFIPMLVLNNTCMLYVRHVPLRKKWFWIYLMSFRITSFLYFPYPALFKKCINLLTILFPWHYIIPAWNSYQILLYGTAIFTNLYPPPFSQLFSFQINRNTRSMPWDYINIVVCIKLSPSLVTGHFFFVR